MLEPFLLFIYGRALGAPWPLEKKTRAVSSPSALAKKKSTGAPIRDSPDQALPPYEGIFL